MNFQRINILPKDSKQVISEKELQVGELVMLLGTNKLYTGVIIDLSGATDEELETVEVNYFNKTVDTLDDITAGATNKHFTDTEKTKLSGIETNADVTDAVNIAFAVNSVGTKATPIDADSFPLVDSADSNWLKRVTWANIKAQLKNYFDGLYASRNSGNWTPILVGSTTAGDYTLDIINTEYSKLNDIVIISGRVVVTVNTPGTGAIVFKGFPFNRKQDTTCNGNITFLNLAKPSNYLSYKIVPRQIAVSNKEFVLVYDSSANDSSLNASNILDIATGTDIRIQLIYFLSP